MASEKLQPGLLATQLAALGVRRGAVLLVRASLGSIGRVEGGREAILQAFMDALGEEGTLVSLAYTRSFLGRADPAAVFDPGTESYAGALPNLMLAHPKAKRSTHPTNSVVAIGPAAEAIVAGHGPDAPAYLPIRKLVELDAQMALVGCVDSSPGFTTAHLVEADIGLDRRVIFPWMNSVYYRSAAGKVRLFRRRSLGLCSNSFAKFYPHYEEEGVLRTGMVGNAHSILVPARKAYQIERRILEKHPRFNVCDNPDCVTCNARRWDRIHRAPMLIARRVLARLRASGAHSK